MTTFWHRPTLKGNISKTRQKLKPGPGGDPCGHSLSSQKTQFHKPNRKFLSGKIWPRHFFVALRGKFSHYTLDHNLDGRFYIGGFRKDENSTWTWTNGDQWNDFDDTKWTMGYPIDGELFCLMLMFDGNVTENGKDGKLIINS